MVDVWLLFFFTYNASITAFHILIDNKFRDEKEISELEIMVIHSRKSLIKLCIHQSFFARTTRNIL